MMLRNPAHENKLRQVNSGSSLHAPSFPNAVSAAAPAVMVRTFVPKKLSEALLIIVGIVQNFFLLLLLLLLLRDS
jgi:hypothetical protein